MTQKKKVGVNKLSDENLGGVSGGIGPFAPVYKTGDWAVYGPDGFHQRCDSKSEADSLAASKGKGYRVAFDNF